MSRAERLLALMQRLRRHRQPVSGEALADELQVSLRTLYRDIASLKGQGARIDGEPGVGYRLRPGFVLPPLMLHDAEIEALVLGLDWVGQRADAQLAEAAREALAKIGAVLPEGLRPIMDAETLLVGPSPAPDDDEGVHLPQLRRALRGEFRVLLRYRDERGAASERHVWPVALGFFDRVRVLVAWCELRADFRHFRTDRIDDLQVSAQRTPERRKTLLARWRQLERDRSPQAEAQAPAATRR
ncbi:MAG TPA: YafY family protein [Burkholderiaceae bacterium]|jgi:predicted DNA-binding transcriptional regulator YafY|nr:YafY family protein [Burkholderiaceae bacterium]